MRWELVVGGLAFGVGYGVAAQLGVPAGGPGGAPGSRAPSAALGPDLAVRPPGGAGWVMPAGPEAVDPSWRYGGIDPFGDPESALAASCAAYCARMAEARPPAVPDAYPGSLPPGWQSDGAGPWPRPSGPGQPWGWREDAADGPWGPTYSDGPPPPLPEDEGLGPDQPPGFPAGPGAAAPALRSPWMPEMSGLSRGGLPGGHAGGVPRGRSGEAAPGVAASSPTGTAPATARGWEWVGRDPRGPEGPRAE